MLKKALTAILILAVFAATANGQPHFASGIKIGETTSDSTIVWVRLTQHPQADFSRLAILSQGLDSGESSAEEMPVDVVPGIAGQARVLCWPANDPDSTIKTDWERVDDATDFTHQFAITGLSPRRQYQLQVEARTNESDNPISTAAGQFRTAPAADQSVPVRFIVSTCQAVRSIDSGKDGHRAYRQMRFLDADFFVHTGDILYYDKAPFCKTAAAARAKWNLMFSYRYNREFLSGISCCFMKDDHDTLKNDCWPGQTYGDLTFEKGQAIFREQVPMGKSTFRTVRWGKDLQIWMTENRDFRSSSRTPDGPEKTILGSAQKAWLMQSICESDATVKFVISPGPIVGPDKPGKADNHANAAFAHEGRQLREFLSAQPNTYVIAGDRHWQYCSRDPATGLLELGCGPINDEHSFGGDPGLDPAFHRYFGARGGFLLVTVDRSRARAEWYHANDPDWTDGQLPATLHTETLPVADIESGDR